ncbi:MAG: IclR family transcriptional regulator [Rhodospirillaceae bacterium]|nr:IclR family transcriptional regulator [Rhodospirillaceae bacterium]
MEPVSTAVPALDKAMRIFDYLSVVGRASFSEIQTALQLPKSSAHDLLRALIGHGCLRQDASAHYSLGMRLYELGNKAVGNLDFRREAMPFLYELRDKTQLTCNLGILLEREALYLSKVESAQAIIVKTWEGRRLPLHCTALGKALIAWKSEAEIDSLFPSEELPVSTETTIPTRTALKQQLAEVRARGWAIDDAEETLGVRCIAAPVQTFRGDVLAAISLSGVDFQIPPSRLEELSIMVKASCIALSRALHNDG